MTTPTMESALNEMPTPFLQGIAAKIVQHERLSFEDGLALLTIEDEEQIKSVGKLANHVRKQKVGDDVLFASTFLTYPTNLCELNCTFCSFYAKPGWDKAWFSSPEEIEKQVRLHYPKGLNEIHIVGGLWRDCDLDYYKELFTRIKNVDPDLHIKALTPVEYDFLAKLHDISIEEVFNRMRSWGLGSLPGGGAEILVEEVRKKIAPGKISSDEFLNIHELAHSLKIPSNVTMLFGHIEEPEHIITHLCKVRSLQDKTNGFKTFIPLKFGEENNALGKRKNRLRRKNIPLVYAVSRLMLDNILHLKVLWNYIGVENALEILDWGANDLSSTNLGEKVIDMAGGTRANMDKETMTELIEQKGRVARHLHSGQL